MLKLNLGCGNDKKAGYQNIDHCPIYNPDRLIDLEAFPWPFDDSSADEILLYNLLTHLGQEPKIFQGIIQELYRVAAPNAIIKISFSSPYHDNYYADPTSCRPLIPSTINLFSKSYLKKHPTFTPFAHLWEVDFEVTDNKDILDQSFHDFAKRHNIEINSATAKSYKNVIIRHDMTLRACKDQ